MVIYKIVCKHNGKTYVGSTVNFKRRKNQHLNKLKTESHHNILLQRIYDKHGVDNLIFHILEEVSTHDELIDREEFYINELNTYKDGLNLKEYHKRKQSFSLSKESREKISKALKGKKKSKKHIENLSKASRSKPKYGLRGKKRSEEQIENIRNGVLNSEKQRLSWEKSKKPILQYTMEGEFIREWDSIIEACRSFGVNHSSNLIKVLKGDGKSFRGYFWRYSD